MGNILTSPRMRETLGYEQMDDYAPIKVRMRDEACSELCGQKQPARTLAGDPLSQKGEAIRIKAEKAEARPVGHASAFSV
ncbi:hypothetical protein [Hydrogeniiclostridium mannosilyticum]|uniref:hypothetical protein n=1 Tax=Hydrogeniiclostridium mannosilyticum TaxID=2764322 RepID=UPI0018AC865A|nr:hypothetical protein [Hydrogeniiclostridium mannosilyticum]